MNSRFNELRGFSFDAVEWRWDASWNQLFNSGFDCPVVKPILSRLGIDGLLTIYTCRPSLMLVFILYFASPTNSKDALVFTVAAPAIMLNLRRW